MKVYIISNSNIPIHSCYTSKEKALKAIRKCNRLCKKVKKFETDFEELEGFLEWGDENKTLDYFNNIIKYKDDTGPIVLDLLDVDKDVLTYDFRYCQDTGIAYQDVRTIYDLKIIEKDLL